MEPEETIKTRILIAEDEVHTLATLFFVLENSGHQVLVATDGQKALEQIVNMRSSSHPIDLLIVDMEMAEFTGLHLLDELYEQKIPLPSIVISAYCDAETQRKLESKGCVEFLIKPFDPDQVTQCVSRILEKSNITSEKLYT